METQNTAKNFALQLGSLAALYVSIIALITHLFSIITLSFPDATDSVWQIQSATASLRFTIAVLIVFFPVYLVLTRIGNKIRRTEHGTYLTLTKWLIYLSLLIAGGVLLGDLVAIINTYLNGEITIRFILKAFVVLVVIGVAFNYYLLDARGYWQTNEKKSIRYGLGVLIFVIISLILGFLNAETPSEVREKRIDEEQIYDLQEIQNRIEIYYDSNNILPVSISSAYEGLEIPKASKGRPDYIYTETGATTYELCAMFDKKSQMDKFARLTPLYDTPPVILHDTISLANYDWSHGEGVWCFEKKVYREEQQKAIFETVRQYNKDIPIVQNMDFGHTEPQIPMPYGNKIRFDSKEKRVFATF